MRRGPRSLLVLVVALGFATCIADRMVTERTGAWFVKDLTARGQLAVAASHSALVKAWRGADWPRLSSILSDLTDDQRIVAAGACSAARRLVAATPRYLAQHLSCDDLGRHVQGAAAGWHEWHARIDEPSAPVFVTAVPVYDGAQALGFVVLAHDLGFVVERDRQTHLFWLLAFATVAAATTLAWKAAGRFLRRSWSGELRRLLHGGNGEADLLPLAKDVRELAERLAFEQEIGSRGVGTWTADRLKRSLQTLLAGEQIVIVANREPYVHERTADGAARVLHPASGLVTALEPVMRACSGIWIAHGAGSADRETADDRGRLRVPPDAPAYQLRRLWLSPEEERGYYYGFANEGLWPLCHLADTRPSFRGEDWAHYESVNRRFADAVCEEVDVDDPIVMVQDYHFALVPRFIRERIPRATIISFWHIPWPNAERFGICPYRDALLKGMLGAGIVGFHTQVHCNNFKDSVDRYMEARVDHDQGAVVFQKRETLVRAYPISVEWPGHLAATAPPPAACRAQVLAELGLRADVLLGVGVDRLDYTKGIEERLLAVERLLERTPSLRGRFVFVQLAAPSRVVIERYRQLAASVESIAARVNARFGTDGYRPIVLLRSHHEPPDVFRFYRAADVCYVSSLHDGMNLVAKEFVAAREDERGVLVLSSFTGAARELTEALIVNPYDLEEASAALAAALAMSPAEQAERMRSMRALVSEFNVYRWAGQMIIDAARLRQHHRLVGRLEATPPPSQDAAF